MIKWSTGDEKCFEVPCKLKSLLLASTEKKQSKKYLLDIILPRKILVLSSSGQIADLKEKGLFFMLSIFLTLKLSLFERRVQWQGKLLPSFCIFSQSEPFHRL